MDKAVVSNLRLDGSKLAFTAQRASLSAVSFAGAEFPRLFHVSNTTFEGCSLTATKTRGSVISRVSFVDSNIGGRHVDGTFSGTTFKNCRLEGEFERCSFRCFGGNGAFDHCDLSAAVFIDCDFRSFSFSSCTVSDRQVVLADFPALASEMRLALLATKDESPENRRILEHLNLWLEQPELYGQQLVDWGGFERSEGPRFVEAFQLALNALRPKLGRHPHSQA